MPSYPVTVTASYVAAVAVDDAVEKLRAWAASEDGRTFTIDDSIAPVRWTVTVDFSVKADSELDAEQLAIEQYRREAEDHQLPPAETVVAATGPLD